MTNFILAVLFFVVSLIKLRHAQMEHFWTRFVASLWFVLITITDIIPAGVVHAVSTDIIIVILLIEIASPLLRKFWNSKR